MTEQDIIRGFQRYFLALADLRDRDAADRIADIVSAHLRSSHPMAGGALDPIGELRINLGPGARPCSVEWLRSLRDQCAATGVPFFLKQAEHNAAFDAVTARDGSKRKAGGVIELPYLDGVQHAAFPEVGH